MSISKDVIYKYVNNLPKTEIEYEIVKYYFKDPIVKQAKGNRIIYLTSSENPNFNFKTAKKTYRKNDFLTIPRFCSDPRESLKLLKLLNYKIIVDRLDTNFLLSTSNFYTAGDFNSCIAKIFLMEFYFKEDFLPNL